MLGKENRRLTVAFLILRNIGFVLQVSSGSHPAMVHSLISCDFGSMTHDLFVFSDEVGGFILRCLKKVRCGLGLGILLIQ